MDEALALLDDAAEAEAALGRAMDRCRFEPGREGPPEPYLKSARDWD